MKVKFYPVNIYDDLDLIEVKQKEIDVDLKNWQQLFDIIKKKRQYKYIQPTPRIKRKLIQALENLKKERKNNA